MEESGKELKVEPRRLYQKKRWLEVYDNEPYRTIRQKVLDAFKGLVFIEDGHKYFLGDRELMCVSNMTHQFQEHFDPEIEAPKTYARRHNDPESPYYMKTVEEIKAMWTRNSNRACTHGTERHEFGESAFHFMIHDYDGIVPAFKDRLMTDENGNDYFLAVSAKEVAVCAVYDDMPDCLVPILAETKVYNIEKEYAYSGTFDILFYYDAQLEGKDSSKNGLFVLDWKGLALNTKIATTEGWKTMGKLQVGDVIYDECLNETKVVHKSEVHHNPCYELQFAVEGKRGHVRKPRIIADHEHRWKVHLGMNHEQVMTTSELYGASIEDERPIMVNGLGCGWARLVKIVPTETVPTQCIEVDSPLHTFCVTKEMIPTHNTNTDIFKNFGGKKLLPPFDDMLDMPKSMYVLQLNSYQMPLEKLGLKVIARRLFWLRPDGTYQKIPLENMTKRLNEALKSKGTK